MNIYNIGNNQPIKLDRFIKAIKMATGKEAKRNNMPMQAENKKQLWIPEGFAHGFLTLSETAELLYKTTNYYSPESERSIIWNDKKISIVWPIDISPSLAMKDSSSPNFEDAAFFD